MGHSFCDRDGVASALQLANVMCMSCRDGNGRQCAECIGSDTNANLLLLAYFGLVVKALHEWQGGRPVRSKPSNNTPCITQQTVPAYHNQLLQVLDVPPGVVVDMPPDNEVISSACFAACQHFLKLPRLHQLGWPTSVRGEVQHQQNDAEECAAYQLLVPILLTITELVLLQPSLTCLLVCLPVSCCMLHHNIINDPCPKKVAEQLLQELLPALVELQLPTIQQVCSEKLVSPDKLDQCHVALACAGAEVMVLFKMGESRKSPASASLSTRQQGCWW
jgi:hypothetical protein